MSTTVRTSARLNRRFLLAGSALASLAWPAHAQDLPADALVPAAADVEAAAAEVGTDAAIDASIADEGIDSQVAGGSGVDPIVVTASRRRNENAQNVPIALTVLSGEELGRRGDYTLAQIQQQIPSLQVFSFNPRNTNVNIRGLGSNVALTNDGLENGVGFYIDNVYYGRVGLSQFDLVDLESVEVLRGPQGTLFGKNTTAGVINIATRKPSFEPELSAEASIGNHGYRQLRASASAPLVADQLAVRLSGAVTDNDGFLYNVTQRERAQDYSNTSIRGQLLFKPADDVSLRIIGDFSRQKQNFVLNSFIAFHPRYQDGTPIANNFLDRLSRSPEAVVPSFQPFDRLGYADSHYQSNMDGYGVSGQLDWDLGGAALTAITAYRWWDWNPANDGDSTNLPVTTKAQQANRQRQFSQELRLASSGDRRLDYVVGAYYFWQIIRGYGASRYGPAAALWNLPNASPVVAGAALDGFEANSTSTPETRSIGVFGQTDFEITDALSLTTGLRFTHEIKQGAFEQFWVDGDDLAALTPAQRTAAIAIRNQFNPITSYATRFSDNSLSGQVSLSWKVAPDVLVYGSYARGNKSGGLNLTVLPVGVSPDVRPEKVDAYELGLKSSLFDRRVIFNAAAFWTEIGDYQTAITEQVANSVNFRQYIANIPKVRSRGLEGDLSFVVSDHLRLNASASYTDATYIDYRNAPQAVERLNLSAVQDLSGERLPGIPKFAWTIGADVDLPVGTWGSREIEFYGHADYAHRSSINTSPSNSAWAVVPAYGLLTARLGVRADDGLWDLSLWAKNLGGKDYFQNLTVANTGVVTGQLGEPRTYGVTLRTRL